MRTAAATQFFVYTMAGSVTLLLAFLAVVVATGKFDFSDLADMGRNGTLTAELSAKLGWRELNTRPVTLIIFAGAFVGFAVKVPLMNWRGRRLAGVALRQVAVAVPSP